MVPSTSHKTQLELRSAGRWLRLWQQPNACECWGPHNVKIRRGHFRRYSALPRWVVGSGMLNRPIPLSVLGTGLFDPSGGSGVVERLTGAIVSLLSIQCHRKIPEVDLRL